jgi:hypothetical protein
MMIADLLIDELRLRLPRVGCRAKHQSSLSIDSRQSKHPQSPIANPQ